VALFSPLKITVPAKSDDCAKDSGSIACEVANRICKWYNIAKPDTTTAGVRFNIDLQLATKVKKVTIDVDNNFQCVR
jgi:hypothetical protein